MRAHISRMESPPPPGVATAGSPSSQTQYSLDLDALNLDDSSGSLSPVLQRHVDKIASDDIDGPSDFTVNMGKWLKDPPPRRAVDTWSFDPLKDEADVDNNAEEHIENSPEPQEDISPEQAKDVADMTFDSVSENDLPADNGDGISQQSNAAPSVEGDVNDGAASEDSTLDLDITEGSVTPRQPEESSIWEPYHNSSSLRFSRPRRFLQPTVEDYNSDLTPARPMSAMNQPTFTLTPDPPRRAASALKMRPSPAGRRSSPIRSPDRSPLITRKENVPNTSPSELEKLRMQLNEERQKSDRLQSELDRIQSRQEKEKEATENASYDLRQEIEELTNDLNSARHAENDALQIAEERKKELNRVQRAEDEAHQLAEDRAKELNQIHESEDAELQDMRWQLRRAEDAETAAKASLDDLRRQMEDQGRAHDEEVQRLGRDLAAARNDAHRASDAEQTAHDELRLLRQQRNEHATALRDETQRLRQELDEAHRQEESARAEADRYYAELEQMKTAQEPTLDTTTNDATRNDEEAMRCADDLRLALEKQLHDAETQIADITHDNEGKSKQLNDAHAQIGALTRDFNNANQTARAAEDDLHGVHAQIAANTQEHETEKEAKETQAKNAQARIDALTQELENDQKAKEDEMREVQAQITALIQGRKADQEVSERQLREVKDQITQLARERETDQEAREKQIHEAQARAATLAQEHKAEQEAREKAEEEAKELKEELDVLQDLHKLDLDDEALPSLPPKELDQLNSGYDKALKLIESLRSEMRNLKRQMKTQQKQHEAEMRSMRSSLDSQKESAATLLAEEKAEHRRTIDLIEEGMATIRHDRASLIAQVSWLEKDHDPHTTKVESLKQDLEKERKDIKKMKEINEAYDVRIAEVVKKRDETWRAKVQDARNKLKEAQKEVQQLEEKVATLEEERKIMGKALMVQWGREEQGVEEKKKTQKYVYQFPKAKTPPPGILKSGRS